MTYTSIRIDPDICTGCRACELACGLHHTGRMVPSASSVKVARSNLTSAVTWEISSTCDVCVGEVRPLCVKYCAVGAIESVGLS